VLLSGVGYLADEATALSLELALALERPLLVEGPAGVGKTDLARSAAAALGRPLVRLQCYEGLDESRALYEWDYAKQMLYTQLVRGALERAAPPDASVASLMEVVAASEGSFFDRRFLVARPLLQALETPGAAVLLVDEVDRADPEFEAFLLEILSEMQVTIPEIGTVRAAQPPLVVLTTNGTRDMTEALRRRCLHLFMDYPAPEREIAIVERRVPGIERALVDALVGSVQRLRKLDLRKPPSIGETVDWARALVLLGKSHLDADVVRDTSGVLLKHQEDRAVALERLGDLGLGAPAVPGAGG
jgi:MoxR-like ATPase